MKPPPFAYHLAGSTEEALALLAEYGDDAKVLAGGQSLILLLNLRLSRPGHLVDVNRLPDLATVRNGSGLALGSMVRHREVERSPAVRAANPLLAEAARLIGHAAIRSRGTVGGSIAHADPAAELPAVAVALDATIEVRSSKASRTIAAGDFFQGFLTTAVNPDELVTAVRFPGLAGGGWSFREFSRRSGDFAIVGVAAVMTLGDGGSIADLRVALCGVASVPVRARDLERSLVGQMPTEALWAEAGQRVAAALDPPSDLHGSAAYRRHLSSVLVARALHEAHTRTEAH